MPCRTPWLCFLLPFLLLAAETPDDVLKQKEYWTQRLEQLAENDADTEAVCRALLRLVPDHAVAWSRWSSSLAPTAPRLASALQEFDRLRRGQSMESVSSEAPDVPVAIRMLYAEMETCADSAERGPCLTALETRVRRELENVLVFQEEWFLAADVFRVQGDFAVAAALQVAGLRRGTPDAARVRRYIGDLERLPFRSLLAAQIVQWVPVQQAPPDMLRFAVEVLQRHDFSREAVPYVRAWTVQQPGEADAWLAQGTIHARIQEPAQAKLAYIQALRVTKKKPAVWLALARLAAEQRDEEEAVVWLRQLRGSVSSREFENILMDAAFAKVPGVLYRLD